jgi:capsular polysaccharide biosynthesis protein
MDPRVLRSKESRLNDWRSNGKARSTLVSAETEPARIDPEAVSNAGYEELDVLSLRHLVQVLLRRIWMILLSAILLAGLVVAYNLQQTPIYEASIKIIVGQRAGVDPMITPPIYDLQASAKTMAEATEGYRIAEAAIQRYNLPMSPDALLENLNAEAAAESQFIEVTYTDPNKARAQQVVNAVGVVLSDHVKELSPSAEGVTATVWEEARMPDSPIRPNPIRNGVLALMVGGMIGIGLAFLLEYLDDHCHSPEEAEQVSGAPTFGAIPSHEVIVGGRKIGRQT